MYKINNYKIDNQNIDSVELKCMVVCKGVKVDRDVYEEYSKKYRIDISPLACNCFMLSDGTVIQMTDMKFHLRYLNGVLSWDNLKLLKYASELGTPFSIKLDEGKAALFYDNELIEYIKFFKKTDFYRQKTASGLPFIGNAVLQGCDWVAFQCLWNCDYAVSGQPCQFCFSGAETCAKALKNKKLKESFPDSDMSEIVDYAIKNTDAGSIQITGGSTFDSVTESELIKKYLLAIDKKTGIKNIPGEILLYITPPSDTKYLDEYFSLGISRIACSIEVWDEKLAEVITPGKIKYTTRKRHLDILQYIAEKYGPGKAFSNFIIGLESIETLTEGASYLAQRGIIPSASVWMPMGKPVMGSMKTPDIDYFRRVKEAFAGFYQKYKLEPAGSCGLNVCIERDIWRYSR